MAERDEDWRRPPAGMNERQAAIGCARASVVQWLHHDRVLLRQARTADRRAFEDEAELPDLGLVLRGLERELGPQGMREFQAWAGASHFWCELLAQFAFALGRYEQFRNIVASTVERALLTRDSPPMPEGLDHGELMGIASHATWRYLLEGLIAASGGFDPQALIWPVRVITVLMCPDASRHPAVREHCLAPIVRESRTRVREEIRDRLSSSFPEDPWFT
ncbi:hypothetical protein [Actinocorallia longicatena]|uniref:Uncharacterized protein n=1 Tax=Actinocorallia longicatena TaxID=111803 RepID=A0ABP6QID4_9ACTN